MKESYFREQRIQYQKCPGCQADIELDTEQCRFCDCKLTAEAQESELESSPLCSVVESDSTGSIVVMLILNIVVSLAGVFVTSADRYSEKPTHDHEFRLAEQDRDYATSLFHKKRSHSEVRFNEPPDRNAVIECRRDSRHRQHRD
ncbi:MAG TPA: hypothetical protein DIT97_30375 [Gimesia maris]|uniref:Uncharacterized protein n=1 Tax=Gimesia maris TaxID=122 RepID=A0A3D3RE40_9PLAN|nr:hypothetical protein [Gimesia maris]|tara:strand:+ start:2752 stop:3186 length:435 start_codon:yes stop_codon:yes gene_type:complete